MMARVFVPYALRKYADGAEEVDMPADTLGELIDNLEAAYPGMKQRLVEDNRIKPSISVAIDGEVTPMGMLEKVGENSEVHFVPAIGGGTADFEPKHRRIPCSPAV